MDELFVRPFLGGFGNSLIYLNICFYTLRTKLIEVQLAYINQLSFDRFWIPVYQRSYVWSSKYALQLLVDILESLDGNRQGEPYR